jgi:hypothetical protein
MAGISPKLPLTTDPDDGYTLNKTLKEMASQNFKMLVLTNPGERIMDPKFGVGILAYLFENNTPATHGTIEARIRDQARRYLPYINVEKILFNFENPDSGQVENFLGVKISYSITKLGIKDVLEVPINL